ncbi:unnamed protein product [Ambrosiozyma monospora]|uniref:Unnamed protein product n=1 Tax=Ambrosiozyma monospora TaxID=43982 RepID=A0ACB5UAL4_AMBMO|nr:unnamed protein product [Ambrosiozyma monospora]
MRTALESPEMEILPIESSELSDEVQSAIENDGATRAIHIKNVKNGLPKKVITSELEKFGILESLKYVPNKNVVFATFTSISSAIKCVEQLALSGSTTLGTSNVSYGNESSLSTATQDNSLSINGSRANIGDSTNASAIDYLNDYKEPNPRYIDICSTPSTSLSPPAEVASTYSLNREPSYFSSAGSVRQMEYASPYSGIMDHMPLAAASMQSLPSLSLSSLPGSNVGNRTVWYT